MARQACHWRIPEKCVLQHDQEKDAEAWDET